jgi:hypothetical protein
MSEVQTPLAGSYEFTAEQGKTISDLGGSMRIVGIVLLSYAVIGIAAMFILLWQTGNLNIDLNPILAVFIGLWAMSAGKSFQQIASTQGNDIGHLMDALSSLRNLFKLMAILIIVALVIALVLLVVILVFRPEGTLIVSGYRVS